MLKTAPLAPSPSASVSVTTAVSPGRFSNPRTASFISVSSVYMIESPATCELERGDVRRANA